MRANLPSNISPIITVRNPVSSKLNDSSYNTSIGGPQCHPCSLIFSVKIAQPAKISQNKATGDDLTAEISFLHEGLYSTFLGTLPRSPPPRKVSFVFTSADEFNDTKGMTSSSSSISVESRELSVSHDTFFSDDTTLRDKKVA